MGIEKRFNDLSLHDKIIADYERVIPLVAEAGLPISSVLVATKME